tara:strand:+ start:586 stop:1188 length:603 start_codon:yes stop_codon:yes gene_type:complete
MSVWKTLSAINVNDNTEKKGNLTYLSWAWAWAVTKQHYPEATYAFLDNEIHADETMTVHCVVSIENINHEMWLPVMDHRNKAVSNPNAFQINTAKMRCLTKGLSMHGLGSYIYAGEDLPAPEPEKSYDQWCDENKDSIAAIKVGIADGDLSSASEAWSELDEDVKIGLWKAPSKGGCFTTGERATMKTTEFKQARGIINE